MFSLLDYNMVKTEECRHLHPIFPSHLREWLNQPLHYILCTTWHQLLVNWPLTYLSSSSSINPLASLSRIPKTFFTSWGLFLVRPQIWKNFLGQKESGAGGARDSTRQVLWIMTMLPQIISLFTMSLVWSFTTELELKEMTNVWQSIIKCDVSCTVSRPRGTKLGTILVLNASGGICYIMYIYEVLFVFFSKFQLQR